MSDLPRGAMPSYVNRSSAERSTTLPSAPCPPYEPRHRKTSCKVPGCEEEKTNHDCCDDHSRPGTTGPALELPNDGLIDWVAIDVTMRGLRKVRLTWVEKDIAAAAMLSRGITAFEIQKRGAGRIYGPDHQARAERAKKIAEAGVLEMLERELGAVT